MQNLPKNSATSPTYFYKVIRRNCLSKAKTPIYILLRDFKNLIGQLPHVSEILVVNQNNIDSLQDGKLSSGVTVSKLVMQGAK